MNHAPARLSAQAQHALTHYPWPGNVRELDNAIQRALILQQGGMIQPQDLCLSGPIGLAPMTTPAPTLVAVASGSAVLPVGEEGSDSSALGDDLRRHEFQMIIDTLRAERGRRKEAAERLGISPRTLRYKLAQMRDAGMDVEAYLFAS